MEPAVLARLVQLASSLNRIRSIETFVRKIVHAAVEMTGAQAGSLLLHDEAGQVLRYADAPWCSDPNRQAALENLAIRPGSGVAAWVFSSRRALQTRLVGQDPLVHPVLELLLGNRVESIAAAPVQFREKPIGVLEMLNARSGAFSSRDLTILNTLASYTATGISHASLALHSDQAVRSPGELQQMQSDFITIASHELRTPLGVIIGHTTLLQEIADREIREHLDVIARNAAQLNAIIENLTVMHQLESEKGALERQIVSLKQVVQQCVRQHTAAAQAAGIALKADLPSADVAVRADPARLLMVMNNLVGNALQFTDGVASGEVVVGLRQAGSQALVAVRDNGIGIAEMDQERIFERFTQLESPLRRKYGGMGVGLSAAKHLVEAFGGKIQVRSRPGVGSVFTVLLPAVDGRSGQFIQD